MINNRLFKKTNSIFWGLLTWFPVVIVLLTVFKIEGSSFNSEFTYSSYLDNVITGIVDIGTSVNDWLYNPLTHVFMNMLNLIGISSDFMGCIIEFASWSCWVQVIRLIAYVFMWFIDFIISLFDYLSLNRKGDN